VFRSTIPLLTAALTTTTLMPSAHSADEGFRKDPIYHTCSKIKADGFRETGLNPDYWGECGKINGGKAPQNLSKLNLSSMEITGVNFDGANLSGANLSDTVIKNSTLNNAKLSGTKLYATEISESYGAEINFAHAKIEYSKFINFSLPGAIFDQVQTIDFAVEGGNVMSTSWKKAEIQNLKLSGGTYVYSNFEDANARGAVLSGNFDAVNFKGANLELTNFSYYKAQIFPRRKLVVRTFIKLMVVMLNYHSVETKRSPKAWSSNQHPQTNQLSFQSTTSQFNAKYVYPVEKTKFWQSLSRFA